MNVGDKVTWTTANGLREGVVEKIDERGALVRLANGKCILAEEDSLTVSKSKWQDK